MHGSSDRFVPPRKNHEGTWGQGGRATEGPPRLQIFFELNVAEVRLLKDATNVACWTFQGLLFRSITVRLFNCRRNKKPKSANSSFHMAWVAVRFWGALVVISAFNRWKQGRRNFKHEFAAWQELFIISWDFLAQWCWEMLRVVGLGIQIWSHWISLG